MFTEPEANNFLSYNFQRWIAMIEYEIFGLRATIVILKTPHVSSISSCGKQLWMADKFQK